MNPKDAAKIQGLADTLLKIAMSDKDRKELATMMEKDPSGYFAKLLAFAPSHQKELGEKKHSDVKDAASFVASVVLAFEPETLKQLEAVNAYDSAKALNPLLTVANAIVLWTTPAQEGKPQTQGFFDDAKNKVIACNWAQLDVALATADLVEAQARFLACMASQAPTFPYPIPSACQGDLMNLNAAIHKFNVVLANAQRLCDYNPFF